MPALERGASGTLTDDDGVAGNVPPAGGVGATLAGGGGGGGGVAAATSGCPSGAKRPAATAAAATANVLKRRFKLSGSLVKRNLGQAEVYHIVERRRRRYGARRARKGRYP